MDSDLVKSTTPAPSLNARASVDVTNARLRRSYEQLLRQFHCGRITNFEYEDAYATLIRQYGRDSAVEAIFAVNWLFYSDLTEHTIRTCDRTVARARRKAISKWVLFLRTSIPYEHPRGSRINQEQLLCVAICVSAFVGAIGMLAGTQRISVGAIVVMTLAYAAVWVRGVALDRVASRLAFTSPTCDYWPFTSARQLRRAYDTPTFLAGVGHRDASTA